MRTEWHYQQKAYRMLNKPAGYECSHQPKHHVRVSMHCYRHPSMAAVFSRLYASMRTTGLPLFSDDGQFIHRISKGSMPKTYHVTANELAHTKYFDHSAAFWGKQQG